MQQMTRSEVIKDYIKTNYDITTPIFLQDFYNKFPDISPSTVRTIFKRLVDAKKIARVEEGTYAVFNPNSILKQPTVFAGDIIKAKYLENENGVFGYVSGINFANTLNLTFQTASVETIYSNNTSNKIRTIKIRGRKVLLKAPRVIITKENFKLLQALDLLNNFESYSEYSLKEAKETILSYLSEVNLDEDELEKIVSKYPLKAQVKFYKIGAHCAAA